MYYDLLLDLAICGMQLGYVVWHTAGYFFIKYLCDNAIHSVSYVFFNSIPLGRMLKRIDLSSGVCFIHRFVFLIINSKTDCYE